jgi:hypothetical protein
MAAANAVDPEPKITKSNLCDEGMNHRRDHTSGIWHPDAGTASKIPHAIATQAKKWKAVLMFGTQPSLTMEDRGRSFFNAHNTETVWVTTNDGELLGLLYREDVQRAQPQSEQPACMH